MQLSIRKRLISGGVWAFFGIAIIAISALAINVLLARILSPKEFGDYYILFSLVSVAVVTAQIGLNHTVVRLVAGYIGHGKLPEAAIVVRKIFLYGILGSIIVAAIITTWLGDWIADDVFNSRPMKNSISFAAILIIVLTIQKLLSETYRGYHDIRMSMISGGLITGVLTVIILTIVWIVDGNTTLKHVVVYLLYAATINIFITGIILLRKIIPQLKKDIVVKENIISITWYNWITSIVLLILVQTDLWILGIFRTQEEVAIYGSAMKLVLLVGIVFQIVNLVVPPLIAELFKKGRMNELERTLRSTASMAGIPSFIILVVFILFGDTLLGALYGQYYKVGFTILVILSIGHAVNVWFGSCGFTLIMTGHQRTMMLITVCSGTITVILGISLVSIYGGEGLAAAYAFGLILQNLLMWLAVRIRINIWTHIDFRTVPELAKSFFIVK